MLSRLSSRLAGRLWAALLVLTIAFHVGTPVAAALDLRSGSAFSVDTVEVAVAPVRKAVAQAVALVPVTPPASEPVVILSIIPVVRSTAFWPDATGPPTASAPMAGKAAPRAPPAS